MSSLSQDQVRLVLRRAAELEQRKDATPDTVGEGEVAEIANEIGIAPEAVREALVELRTGSLPAEKAAETSLLDKLVGPADIVVGRTVKGPAAQVQLLVSDFLKSQLLEVKRNLGDRGQIWGPAPDLWSSLRRTFDVTQKVVFEKGTEIVVTVTPHEAGEVVVRITARFADKRRSRGWSVAAGTLIGTGLAAGGVALLGPAALDAAAVAAGTATAGITWLTVRSEHRKDLSRAEQALLRFMDRLEYER